MAANAPARKRSSWGPPRKAQHQTGATPDFARAIASALPATKAANRSGRTTYSVGAEKFLRVDGEHATVTNAEGDEAYQLYDVGRDELRTAIVVAWRNAAPTRGVTAYDKQAAARAKQKAVTAADIRRVVLALPGAAEGPIWGKDIGFLIGSEKKTRFARFGPPVGGRIGNLLPPDDEDALVILRCEQRHELLASAADRFFTTPHYGDPDGPGGIITRLSENRGREDLQELAELLEDAWRDVALPEQIAQLERERSSGRTR